MSQSISTATIILAGGQGTRLHPLTIHHSKPGIAFGGRYRLIDVPISNSINSDFRQIFVIAQYLSGELQNHISRTYHFDQFNPGSIDVLTPQENEKGEKVFFEGTADAVRQNLPTLLKSNADYFLILSGDQLYNINFKRIVAFAEQKNAELTIAAIPVRKKEAKRMGVLNIDKDYKVIDFVEKPTDTNTLERFLLSSHDFDRLKLPSQSDPCFIGSMGIYVFKRAALIALLREDQRNDFGYHLINTSIQKHKTFAFMYHGYWEDIGTVASYYEANLILTCSSKGLDTYDEQNPIFTRPTFLPGPKIKSTAIKDSIICEGSIIEAEKITNCVIGLRSHIKKGSILRDTVMMGNHFYMPPIHQDERISNDFSVGEFCVIQKAIIDEHVHIGNRVKLINKKNLEHYDDNGNRVFIRDGIIIVISGANLPDGFEI